MKDIIRSVFKVFDKKQKRRLLYVAVMMLINSAVSLLGVSVLLPFIQAVDEPGGSGLQTSMSAIFMTCFICRTRTS